MGKRGPKPRRKEVVWSSEFAYAVGLIATDGCLSSDGRHLIFVSKDIEQLNNLKNCLGLKVKLGKHYTGRKEENIFCHRVQWGDVFLYAFLVNIGLTPNKSLTLGELVIPDEYFFDFLRGSFDGDGSFYSYYDPRWKSSFMFYLNFTSASPVHVKWLRRTIERLIQVKGHVSRTKETEHNHGIETLRYAKAEALVVLRAMYMTASNVHLSRKRLKIVRALRIVRESLPAARKRSVK